MPISFDTLTKHRCPNCHNATTWKINLCQSFSSGFHLDYVCKRCKISFRVIRKTSVNLARFGEIPRQSPFTPADEQFLLETFTECRVKLSEALKVSQGYARLPDLAAGVGDALQGIHDAAAVVIEPETYLE